MKKAHTEKAKKCVQQKHTQVKAKKFYIEKNAQKSGKGRLLF